MYKRLSSQEILRRWIASICGPPNFQKLATRSRSRPGPQASEPSSLVRLCAMHWLQRTRAQRRASSSLPPVRAPVSVSLSAQISLAHVPPRRLSSELLSDLVPSELTDTFDLFSDQSSLEDQPLPTPLSPLDPLPPLELNLVSGAGSGGEIDLQKIAGLELMVEDLFQKVDRGNESQKQELAQLLREYADLIETLKANVD
jgi:hypothetical protein